MTEQDFTLNSISYISGILSSQGIPITYGSAGKLRDIIDHTLKMAKDYKLFKIESLINDSIFIGSLPDDINKLEAYVSSHKKNPCIIDYIQDILGGAKPIRSYNSEEWGEQVDTLKDLISEHKNIVRYSSGVTNF